MYKAMKFVSMKKPGVGAFASAALMAALILPSTSIADQLDPTIDLNYYTADPDGDVYTLITGADAGGDPLAGDGPLYICGTDACDEDLPAIEDRSPSINNLDGYAQVTIIEYGPAGSGYDQDGDVFLRQQHNEQTQLGNNTYETAYNTDSTDLQSLNDPTGPINHNYENMAKDTGAGGDPDFNHAILWSEDLVNEDGNLEFLLDINEAESTSDILLDELSFWVSTSNTLNVYDPDCDYVGDGSNMGCFVNTDGSIDASAIKVWDMDWDTLIAAVMLDNTNDSGKAGSGDYDAIFALDATLFLDAIATLGGDGDYYIYLENTMGRAEAMDAEGNLLQGVTCTYKPNGDRHKCSGGEVDAGFEEWKIATFQEPGVPIPSTAFLLSLGALAFLRRKRAS